MKITIVIRLVLLFISLSGIVCAEEGMGGQNEVFTLQLPGNVKLEMVKIHAGIFQMGSPDDESGRGKNEKQHTVQLKKDYWIGKFEITQQQYKAVTGDNPSRFCYHKNHDRLPVEQIAWEDAFKFCMKLNQLTEGKRPAGYRFNLPTEAQWEYACRAGSSEPFYPVKKLSVQEPDVELSHLAWHAAYEADDHLTRPVGQKRPNAWGLYDMLGNVNEWCLDRYEVNYAADPEFLKNQAWGNGRVFRGGSYKDAPKFCRAAARRNAYSPNISPDRGFRLALVPESK